MNEKDILSTAVNVEEHSLSELQYWLQYEKHTWFLGAGVFWLPYGLILMGLSILAVLFTPYMIWHLFNAKWYKSIAVFLTVVILPFILSQFIPFENSIFVFLSNILPLVAFYFYTWILSYLIGEHLNEIQTLKKWRREERSRS